MNNTSHRRSFPDNYRALLALIFFISISYTAVAQYDSTKVLQDQNAYGFNWKNGAFRGSLRIPTGDTITMAVADSGSVRYYNGGQFYWNGYYWVSTGSGAGTTVVSDSAWMKGGNDITDPSLEWVGTKNAQDFIGKANNTELIRLLSTGGIRLPATTDSTTGVIFKGSDRFIHSYQNPATSTTLGTSLYIGRKSGNFSFTGASGGFGGRNLAIGDSTLYANTTGYRNVAIGVWNSSANTSGFENTSVGANAHEKNTTGYDNTAVGAISLQYNTTGWRNTALGFSSLQFNTTGARNTAIGGRALANSSTSFANVAVGFDALYGNTIGDHNVAVGLDALYWSDGTHNTAIGDSTLWGIYNSQKHMGYKNTAIGSRSGYHLGDTYPNFASIFDTAVTFLGANASRDSSIPYTTSLQNMTVIGYDARGFASNQVVLGNDNVTTTLLKGSLNARGYGIGTYTGTAATYPAFDASGNIIESVTPYGGGSSRFGVSGEDATATQHRTFTHSGYDFQLYSVNGDKQQLLRSLPDSSLGLHLRNNSSADLAYFLLAGIDSSAQMKGGRVSHGSGIKVSDAGVTMQPYLGLYNIDSLNNETSLNTIQGWTETAGADRGKVGYITVGSGLNLASGVLTATGGGVSALAAIGSSPNANGATISGITFNLEPASASFGGVITTGAQTFSGVKTFPSPVFTTSAETPLLIGGPGTTDDLILKVTTGAGTTGSFMDFLVGNNGAVRAMRINDVGGVGILAPTTIDANHGITIKSPTNTAAHGLKVLSLNETVNTQYGSFGMETNSVYTITATGGRIALNTTSGVYAGGNATPNSTLQTAGSFATAYRAITAIRTLDITDHTINCTANTFTVTLPTAASITGREYTIVNSGSGTITIATTSSQTFINIDGTPTTLTLDPVGAAAVTSYTLKSTGAAWMVTSKVLNP